MNLACRDPSQSSNFTRRAATPHRHFHSEMPSPRPARRSGSNDAVLRDAGSSNPGRHPQPLSRIRPGTPHAQVDHGAQGQSEASAQHSACAITLWRESMIRRAGSQAASATGAKRGVPAATRWRRATGCHELGIAVTVSNTEHSIPSHSGKHTAPINDRPGRTSSAGNDPGPSPTPSSEIAITPSDWLGKRTALLTCAWCIGQGK